MSLTNHADYWRNINEGGLDAITRSKEANGIVFRSGGTTGNPKFSVYSAEEWNDFCLAFGYGMSQNGIGKGTRIGNLFFAGDLYASFLFITKSLEYTGALQYPIEGHSSFESVADHIEIASLDALACVPSWLVQFSKWATEKNLHFPKVKTIYAGGELLFPEQLTHYLKVFPEARVTSIGCASVDAGLIGFATPDCKLNEHRVFSDDTTLEIIDEETSEPILEAGKAGKIYVTNFSRKVMAIERYPVGDLGMWIDEDESTPNRKFLILGRSEEGARLSSVSLYYEDVKNAFQKALEVSENYSIQMHIERRNELDALTIRYSGPAFTKETEEHILLEILNERKPLKQVLDQKLIAPISFEYIGNDKAFLNPRTGKFRRVVDERVAKN